MVIVHKYQPPQIIAHFFECTQKFDHQLQAHLIVAVPHTVGGAYDHDLFSIGFRLKG